MASNECGGHRGGLLLGCPGGRNLPRLCYPHSPPGFLSPPGVRRWPRTNPAAVEQDSPCKPLGVAAGHPLR
jgi:hypothetical protein